MQIILSGIPIEIRKKKIKNLYIHVKPPDGDVAISAPMQMGDGEIEEFARNRLDWIRAKVELVAGQSRREAREYVSGETIFVWGREFSLVLEENCPRNSFVIQGDCVILSMRGESTAGQREKFVREQYRALLKSEVERLLPKWEAITGFHCESWRTKYMTTRWGTCNTVEKRLWFNVQLAGKPVECLDYVVLHELAHTKVGNHGPGFVAIMDRYMPEWRERKKRLNQP